MILLFTDFGHSGPYQAQVHAAIRCYSKAEVVTLFADAPVHNPQASACLLAAYMTDFPEQSVFLCVVDPDVGSGVIKPVIVTAANRWFIGPNNGLFDQLMRDYPDYAITEISWKPALLSASFHGRDLFAPIAAMIAEGKLPEQFAIEYKPENQQQEELAETIYIDHFGNVMTGLRACLHPLIRAVRIKGVEHLFHRTFSDVQTGHSLSYVNANGLVEIAVNRGRAADQFNIEIGQAVELIV